MPADIPGFLYAGAVAAGGIAGYYKKGSVPSLVAGLLFGGALAFGALQVSQDSSNYGVQLGTTLLLTGVMGYRFYNSGKIMPAGVVTILSLAMLGKIVLTGTASATKA